REGDTYDLTREGGHSARRILHAQDFTGREISRALRAQVEAAEAVTKLSEHIAVDLITLRKLGRGGAQDRCIGAYLLNHRTGEVETVRAKCTLLATGGAGKLYL